MEKIVERVVRTYGMLENLNVAEVEVLRDRVRKFVEHKTGDEGTITVEAMKYLRGPKPSRTRRRRGDPTKQPIG